LANSIVTNQYIAREFIRLSRNKNGFLQSMNRDYDSEFERTGAKAGQSIRIRQPVEYNLRSGPTAIVQDSVQKVLTMTVATQIGVDMSFSSVDRTMNIDRFSKNFIDPAVNRIVGGIATDVMSGAEGGASNWSANYDANGALLSPTINTWLNAKAAMENNSVPFSDYKIVMHPNTQANTVGNLAGFFNSQQTIAKQYDNGEMYKALGFDWLSDPTTIVHTTGAYATTPTYTAGKGFAAVTVAGAGQTGSNLTVSALAGPLNKGDIITIDGVFGVNPVNKNTTGRLRHFTITANVAGGATVLPIYPAILGVDGGGAQQQFQTVTASPANSAQVYVVTGPGVAYRKNLAYVPEAMTVASVDLIMPPNVDAAREALDNISVRVVTQYLGGTDQLLTRLDLLYGYAWLKPEWVVVVPDPIT
jgi:hypothetical protein